MEQRRQIIRDFVGQGMRVESATAIASMSKSTYYYKSKGKRRGKLPSTHTLTSKGLVTNEKVVVEIEDILSEEFNDYGYHRTTGELRNRGYTINPKKVYRLMKENNLLLPPLHRAKGSKTYVNITSPQPQNPFETVETDIKYVHIDNSRRNAYLITLFDVMSRTALEWTLGYDMKTERVIDLLNRFKKNWLKPLKQDPKKITVRVRTDNGSQFIANMFKEHLKEAHIQHEYIHPGTPEENGHIESFHSTVEKLVVSKYQFENLEHAQSIFGRFFQYYNCGRIMKAICYKSPLDFLNLWYQGRIKIQRNGKKQKYNFREKPIETSTGFPSEVLLGFDKNKYFINSFNNHTLI